MSLRAILLMLACGPYMLLQAQVPLTRSVDLRGPMRESKVQRVVQDAQGFLWTMHEHGLTRHDGRRVAFVHDTGGDEVTALGGGPEVVAALRSGLLLRARGQQVDTLWADTVLRSAPVRVLRTMTDGSCWAGTYGGGLLLVRPGGAQWVAGAQGLADDHVNAIQPLGDGRVAVATDQGVDLLDAEGNVLQHMGEQDGLPDNLVLSLTVDGAGNLWGGTHHGGVFRAAVGKVLGQVRSWACPRPVQGLQVTADRVWAATGRTGVMVRYPDDALGEWVPIPGQGGQVQWITSIDDGSVWWCDGRAMPVRAHADADLFPEHEGVDLRMASALSIADNDELYVAAGLGIFVHPTGFRGGERSRMLQLGQAADKPIVSLLAVADGSLWAGSFGDGLYLVAPDGRVQRSTEQQGLCNANVMALAQGPAEDDVLWVATLGGVCRKWPGGFSPVQVPGAGFIYDVVATPDGGAYLATDGNGVLRVAADGRTTAIGTRLQQRSTYYSLCVDRAGAIWALGPGTGLCRVEGDSLVVHAALSGDVEGIRPYGQGVVALGPEAMPYLGAAGDRVLDWRRFFELDGVRIELNALAVDGAGALWLATEQGLLRLRPDPERLARGPAVVITTALAGHRSWEPGARLPHDRNDIELRFAAPYYALANGEMHYEYRLAGLDTTLVTTTDDRLVWPRLPAGNYRFAVRAVAADGAVVGPWTELSFRIAPAWWATWWAIGLFVVLLAYGVHRLIRLREARLRFHERVEQDKARFQLQVLRSQVNPHFLFNSFNTLTELIEVDRDKALEHVGLLSDLYREILQVRDKDLVPLREELRLVRIYFQLEQRRFGERIRLDLDVRPECLSLQLPPLTLQMLVENALKHNVADMEQPLVVHVVAEQDTLEVWNPWRPRTSPAKGTGFGVSSIRKRYAGLTDRPVEVSTDHDRFTIRIPLLSIP